MSSEAPSRYNWEELLNDKDIVVLTKATFFRTVVLLFQFAEAPGRRTWEFFHYRGLEYILGTWCATFNIEGFAVSCGAQHPFIYRFKRGMHYALPDYVLLSHSRDANGEQEDQLVLVVEIKALGEVDPDTQAGRETAESIFQRTWKQRENQARLAFRSHPSQQDVHIVMVSGPWFALYIYERSQLVRDGAPIEGHLLRDSPPKKRRRRDAVHADRDDDAKPKDERAVRPGEAQKDAGDTRAGDSGEQEHTTDSGKRKREAKAGQGTARAPLVVINHVFQLGPSGERNALNPWFLRLLGQMKDNLERFRGEFRTQNSWFDWPTEVIPTGDGHAEGFILPTTGRPSPDVEGEEVDHVTRLDEDPVIVSVPSTPGNARETLNMMQLNALLSPTIHRTPRVFHGGSDVPSLVPDGQTRGTLPLQPHETQSVDSAPGTDDAATPKAQRGRQSQEPSFGRQDRELSPSTAYLERRQHGPVIPPQLYSAPPDSSPPRSTPPRLSWSRMDSERDSESSVDYDAGTPDSAGIPRPVSAPPTSSSPPSRASHNTMAAHSVSREHQSRPSDRPRQERVIRPIPSSRTAQPSGTYQPPRAFHKGALVRPPTETTSDLQPTNTGRETATEQEWQRRPPTKDELLMHALKATRGTDGNRDLMQAYRNAGMNEKQAARACEQHNKTLPRKQPGENPPRGPSATSGSRSTTAPFAVPLAVTRRPAEHTSDRGEGPSQRPPSGVATGPPTTHAATRASSSRPPPMDGASVARTAGLNQGHSQSSNDDFPDDVPGISRPTSAPLTSPSPGPSVIPEDFKAGSSREHHPGGRPHRSHSSIQPGPRDRSLDDLEATSEAQVNRLTERIGNLGVTNVPVNAGDPKWDNPSLESLYVLGEIARKGGQDVREVFRSVGMDERQVEDACERYRLHVHDQWTDMDLLRALVASSDGTASTRPATTSAGHPREGSRRATTTSEVRSPRPSNPSWDRGEPPTSQANPGFALPGTNLDRGRMSTNTGRKGKEKQG